MNLYLMLHFALEFGREVTARSLTSAPQACFIRLFICSLRMIQPVSKLQYAEDWQGWRQDFCTPGAVTSRLYRALHQRLLREGLLGLAED